MQMQEPSALGRIVALVRDLRARCSWDAAQTPETLRPYLVEEVLELDQAIGSGDRDRIRDELGDLLLHLAFQIVLAEERGDFGAEDLTRAVEEKMWRRHPHLFPDAAGRTASAPPESWERSKREQDAAPAPSVLDGLPPTLPALIMAFRLQERAAGVGFDWTNAAGPLAKVHEEAKELDQALEVGAASLEIEREIGDLLFAVVNLARKLDLDPRAALEKANAKFSARFRRIEALAEERGIDVGRAGLEVLDRLWDEVKAEG